MSDQGKPAARSCSLTRLLELALFGTVLMAGCRPNIQSGPPNADVLRMAVTTSTRDSGLLDLLIPLFERDRSVRVDVIAVGTGNALKLGETGDVDVVFVHARKAEDEFMAAGYGSRREDVMYNTFELLGPPSDPAGIRGVDPVAALVEIAASKVRFVSRGDNSGTHQKELVLWRLAGGSPNSEHYVETGQGMGRTLIVADQMQAYVLADRGTYLQFRPKVQLVPLAAWSEQMHNPYGIMVVNSKRHPEVNEQLAQAFVDFVISQQAQRIIRDFRVDGEPLFLPLRLPEE